MVSVFRVLVLVFLLVALLPGVFGVPASSYSEMRGLSGSSGDSVELSHSRFGGNFAWSSSDPNGFGDDGGIVISASGGGYWVRQWNYDPNNPIELDWFESIQNNVNVMDLLNDLASAYSPDLYIQVPTSKTASQLTLRWSGMWDLSCHGHSVERFRFLESDAKVTLEWESGSRTFIYFDESKSSDCALQPSEFVFGSAVEKASRDDYNLVLDGGVDGPSTSDSAWLIRVHGKHAMKYNSGPYPVTVRANLKNSEASGLLVGGAPCCVLSEVRIGGSFESAPLRISGSDHVVLEDVYYSDPYARWMGWTGSGSASDYHTWGSHGFKNEFIRINHLEGSIEMQYGGTHWFMSNVEWIGSPEDPFVMIGRDMGRLGPGSGSVGTLLDKPSGLGTQWGKTDPITTGSNPQQGRRFWKMVSGPHDHGPPANFVAGAKLEATDNACNSQWQNAYINFTLDGMSGFIGIMKYCEESIKALNHGHSFTGTAPGELMIYDRNLVYDGTFGSVSVIKQEYGNGPSFGNFHSCRDNVIRDSIINGQVRTEIRDYANSGNYPVDGGCSNTVLRDLTFTSSGDIIEVSQESDISAFNICAPVGARAVGSGVFRVNGNAVSLPYTFDGSECSGSSVIDSDGDGYDNTVDCNDNDANVNPGASEVCDSFDNDCDGSVDEGGVCVVDSDGDGFDSSVDCDDDDDEINPGASEVCDSIDNNCDGSVDENSVCDSDFASPIAGFTINENEGVLDVSVDDLLVYHTAYYRIGGGSWQSFTFEGRRIGSWVAGVGSTSLDLSSYSGSNVDVVVYSCSYESGWDCRENWQLRSIFIEDDSQSQSGEVVILDSSFVLDDTYVDSGDSASNFGSSDQLFLLHGSPSNAKMYSLIKFDVSSLSGQVNHANLSLFLSANPLDEGDSFSIGVRRLLDSYTCEGISWVESCPTWDSRPGASHLGSVVDSVSFLQTSPTNVHYVWDVTDIVSDAVNEGASSVSFYLDGVATDGSTFRVDRGVWDSSEGTSGPILTVVS